MKTKMITRTAILLALTIVFQMLGRFMGPSNNLIVGSLVNAILLVATAMTGLWGGTAIAVIAPFVSAFTNKAALAPLIIYFSPFIALGNFVLVLSFHLLMKRSKIAGILVGAVVKFGVLYGAITCFINAIKASGLINIVKLKPEKITIMLTGLFSWSQLLTAIIGGTVALVAIKALDKAIDK